MVRRTIRRRLVLALLAVAAVPLIGIGLYASHTHTVALEELALSSTRDRVTWKARRVEEQLGALREELVFLARSPVLISLLDGDPTGPDRLSLQFMSFTVSRPVFASLSYLDEEGDEVVQVRQDGQRSWIESPDHRQRRALDPSFRAAMAQAPGEVYAEALNGEGAEAREPVVRYAIRVAGPSGRPRGVLVADLFARQIVDTVRDDGSSTWLLDEVGWTVSPSVDPPPQSLPDALASIRDQLRETATLVETGDTVRITWSLVHPAGPGVSPTWLLAERMPNAAVFASVHRFQFVFAGLVITVILAAVGLSLALSTRIAQPLAHLSDGARRLADGDLSHRLDVATGDEIEQLAQEFNRMGDALQTSYRQLERREADKTERLEEVSQQLVESERLAAVGRLAAGVAHEVNNPAGVVFMYIQQLLEDEDRLTTQQVEKLRIIERHAERLGRITGGLLDFARVREYRRSRLDLGLPPRRAWEALSPRLEAAAMTAHFEVPEETLIVHADSDALQQVFENLITNALHAAPGGELRITAAQLDDARAVVTVSDSGPGIAPENLERIFEPFFTTKEPGQGTGLGLAISYGIIRAHGGQMTAANHKEGGACFTVELPLAEAT